MSGVVDLQAKLEAPLLEEGAEYVMSTMSQLENEARSQIVPHAARVLRIGAKLLAKACGVAIAWSWADAIHTSFSDHFLPVALTAFAGLLYAILMTAFTTFMVKYIAEGAGDPDNVEYGKFGEHSRELLLIVQPMMLAWAWKDALREVIWDRLPDDSEWMLVAARLVFASVISALLALLITRLAERVESLKTSGEDGTYTTVAMSLLSAAFGLFIAWCWNSVAQALGAAVSEGATATAVSTLVYALMVTGLAAWITSDLADQLRRFANNLEESGSATAATKPVWLKFIDLVMVSIGYIVGWAWSDAAVNCLLEAFAFTDAKMLYLVYSILVTVAAIVFSYHMASVVDNPDTTRLARQYMTLFLNALALMTGWAWKSYIQYFVELFVIGGAGEAISNWFQAFAMTAMACFAYHKICLAAKAKVSEAEQRLVDQAGGQMD